MNDEARDTHGIDKTPKTGTPGPDMQRGPGPSLMGAATLIGDDVYNADGEDLGEIREIMLDMSNGCVSYAVLSFGAFLGMGKKLFAVPWAALQLDTEKKRFTLNVPKERLERAPGFDRDKWPNMADPSWAKDIHSYYGTTALPGADRGLS
jgi:sporulation protein YlmC with PRC-barrel domain